MKHPLSIEDVARALAASVGVTNVLVELLYASGGRVSELVALTWGDVDLDAATVRLRGKGGDMRLVPLGRPAVAALRGWANNHTGSNAPCGPQEPRSVACHDTACVGDCPDGAGADALGKIGPDGASLGATDRVFPGLTTQAVRDRLKTLGRRIGLHLTPHLFRHAFASHLHSNGASERVIMDMLGHRRVDTTQIYLDVSDRTIQEKCDLITRAMANIRGRGDDPRTLRRTIGGLVLR